jgi:hypothetical protein
MSSESSGKKVSIRAERQATILAVLAKAETPLSMDDLLAALRAHGMYLSNTEANYAMAPLHGKQIAVERIHKRLYRYSLMKVDPLQESDGGT